MTYALRDTARSQMKSRLEKIDASSGSAGSAVSEDYGNKAAGPSSSAKFKRGGTVTGKKADREMAEMETSAKRLDRPHRASGGAVKANKGKTNINIIIAPQGGDKEPMPMPAGPPPAPPMAGPPPGPPPGGPPIPPQALAALAGQAGGPPPMRKRGGAVKRADGGEVDGDNDSKPRADVKDMVNRGRIWGSHGQRERKNGGAVKMDDGAGGGAGRLEKIAAYGKKAK